MASAYPINVFWSDEDGSWVADVPDLTYCSALGDTPHEAVAEVELAIAAWLDAAKASGRQVPEPSRGAVRA
jgi:predicted RNase H-like HicB family nuclease